MVPTYAGESRSPARRSAGTICQTQLPSSLILISLTTATEMEFSRLLILPFGRLSASLLHRPLSGSHWRVAEFRAGRLTALLRHQYAHIL